jgi:N-acyl-D-amino-acid deacylase
VSEWFLTGGTVVDGTGASPFVATVHLRDERIVRIGTFEVPPGAPVIDCAGLTIAPGFVDSHSHSDLQVLEGRSEKLRQGVTTEVVGNCGFSTYPAARDLSELHEFANGILCGDDHWGWPSTKAYLEDIAKSRTANVISLVGHGSLRIAVAGNRQGELPEPEVAAMEALLADALDAGAAGFSTGLMYAPGSSAPFAELERLCRVVANKGKIYTSHIRSYSHALLSAIEEQIELVRRTGCRLQISHLQAVGAKNWPLHQQALDLIENAHTSGIDVEFDCYPYIAGSTVLTQILPQKYLDGGIDALLERIANPTQRAEISRETCDTIAWRWDDILISSLVSAQNRSLIGRSLAQIAADWSCEPIDALLDLLVEEKGTVNMISFNQSEDNLRRSLTNPLATIISDGFYVKGRPHPRLHGTFPLLVGNFSRDRRWLSLPEAIHKITQKPCIRFGIGDRGVLRAGTYADICVFDVRTINSPATYESPDLPPVGIREVFLKGVRASG